MVTSAVRIYVSRTYSLCWQKMEILACLPYTHVRVERRLLPRSTEERNRGGWQVSIAFAGGKNLYFIY